MTPAVTGARAGPPDKIPAGQLADIAARGAAR
jgi:hypothetical protein